MTATPESIPAENKLKLAELLLSLGIDQSNGVGEALREATFVGEGFGCYYNFDVREDARKWDEAEKLAFWRLYYGDSKDMMEYDENAAFAAKNGTGLTFELAGFEIRCAWYWDGDGVLFYQVFRDGVHVVTVGNTDCKKNYTWRDMSDDFAPAV